jgi:hypothetical protein
MGLFRRKPKPEIELPTKTTVSVQSRTIDAANTGGLRDELLETLKEHGIEPGQNRVVDASSIPGLTEEIMGELNKSGVLQQAFGAMGAALEPAHDDDDPVAKLGKLAELHKQGVLSDYEFAVAKQKLLDERWES